MKTFISVFLLLGLATVAYSGPTRVIEADVIRGNGNLIKNGDFESNTTSPYSLYNDGVTASPQPIDGTGGVASTGVTFTVSGTNPLADSYSAILAIPSNTPVGNGVSIPFTVQGGQAATVLNVSFKYRQIGTGYTDGLLRTYLYDVTNSQLIEPVPTQIMAVASPLPGPFSATFQTSSNATSYRLILAHLAAVPSVNVSMQFDNISVKQEPKVLGSMITDWQDFTPTGSWTSNATYTGRWRRIGSVAEIQTTLSLSGAPNNSDLSFNLPSGLVIDTSKLGTITNNANILGTGSHTGAATYFTFSATYSTTTAVRMVWNNVSGSMGSSYAAFSSTAPVTFANGSQLTITYRVPILGWSSSTTMSSDAGTREISAIYASNGGQALTALTTNITWSSKVKDTTSSWNGTVFTVPESGVYRIVASIYLTASVNGRLILYRNGSFSQTMSPVLNVQNHFGSTEAQLNVGETISIRFDGNATLSSASDANNLSITKLSSPQQIAASEKVIAIVDSCAGETVNTGVPANLNFSNTVKDTHGAVTKAAGAWNAATGNYATNNWSFKAPKADVYNFNAYSFLATTSWTFNINNYIQFGLFVNGVYKRRFVEFRPYSTQPYIMFGGGTSYPLNQGDVVTIVLLQTSGANIALAPEPEHHYLDIRSNN